MPHLREADRFTAAYGLMVERDERGNLRLKVDDAKAGTKRLLKTLSSALGLAAPGAGAGASAPHTDRPRGSKNVLAALHIKSLAAREYRLGL